MGLLPPTYYGQPKTEWQKIQDKYGHIYRAIVTILWGTLLILGIVLICKWVDLQAGVK